MTSSARTLLSHWSSAERLKLPLLRGFTAPAVALPPHAVNRSTRPVVVFWSPTALQTAVEVDGELITDELRTVTDCARVFPLYDAVALIDASIHSGLLLRESLDRAAAEATGHGSARLRRAIAMSDGRAMSPQESIGRIAFQLLRIVTIPQGRLPGYWHGFDLLMEAIYIVIEQQSKTHHTRWPDRQLDMTHLHEVGTRKQWTLVQTEPADAWPRPERFVRKVVEVAVVQRGPIARTWRRRFSDEQGRVGLSPGDLRRVRSGLEWPQAAARFLSTVRMKEL